MTDFYVDHHALSALAQLLLTLGISLYLLGLHKKVAATRWLQGFFLAMVLYAAASLVEAASLWSPRFFAVHLQVIALGFAVAALIQFAYRFPGGISPPFTKREVRWALAISALVVAVIITTALYQFGQFQPGAFASTRTLVGDYWIIGGLLWICLILVRRARHLSTVNADREASGVGLPVSRAAATSAIRSFALIFGIAALFALFLAVGQWLPVRSSLILDWVASTVVLLMLFLIAITYLNHTTERSSVVTKLIAIFVLTLLITFGLIGAVVDSVHEATYDPAPLAPQALRFTPLGPRGYAATTSPPTLDDEWGDQLTTPIPNIPFEFALFGAPYSTITIHTDGVLDFGEQAWWRRNYLYNLRPAVALEGPESSTLWVKRESEQLSVTWDYAEGYLGPNNAQRGTSAAPPTVVQMVLEQDGSITVRWSSPLPLDRLNRLTVQSGKGGSAIQWLDPEGALPSLPLQGDALIFSPQHLQREQLDRWLQPLAWLLVFATVASMVILPYFLRWVLSRPLDALVSGVRAVDAGDLQVQVPIFAPDELGVVAEQFNRMVASVRRTDEQLESQVAARTTELSASEARYRKLFDTMASGVVVLARDDRELWRLRAINRAGERLEGITAEGVRGRAAEEVAPLADNHTLLALVQRAWQAEPLVPLPPVRYQVSSGWREATAYKLPPDEVVLVFDDVTARVEAEAQAEQLALLEERERIGRDLHDNLGQVLAFVNTQSQAALTFFEQEQDAQEKAALEQLVEVTRVAQDDLRQTILATRPPSDASHRDFFSLLEGHLATLNSQYGMTLQMSIPTALRHEMTLAAEVESQLLSIVQEALANVRKHATRLHARLLFTLHEEALQVIISDEGPGFEPAAVAGTRGEHFGLDIMRERAGQVGGRVEVRSAPGAGTDVIVHVPRAPDLGERSAAGVRVLVVDDHRLYREGLRSLLAARGMTVVGSARDGIEAQERAEALRPDLILMDVEMPRRGGIEATRHIKAAQPNVTIVMLSVVAEPTTVRAALDAGASGYLLKSQEGDRFVSLLGQALGGQIVVSPTLAAELFTDPSPADPIPLTERQLEVLRLLVAGQSNRQIAAALHITERTVKYHVSNLLAEVEARDRQELVRIAGERGWS